MSEKQWMTRAKQTYKFHREHLLSNPDWTLVQTAKSLRRSLGPVSEEIKVAKWCKTHENVLEKFDYIHEAIDWIRKKQKEMDTAEIE